MTGYKYIALSVILSYTITSIYFTVFSVKLLCKKAKCKILGDKEELSEHLKIGRPTLLVIAGIFFVSLKHGILYVLETENYPLLILYLSVIWLEISYIKHIKNRHYGNNKHF